ncbi:MAG: hypothetical protein DMF53_23750 [Acidobacteria bacterium]|nr:MAG: hypothetical protein DMF53_23750 [Acidobacteriota bacterium]
MGARGRAGGPAGERGGGLPRRRPGGVLPPFQRDPGGHRHPVDQAERDDLLLRAGPSPGPLSPGGRPRALQPPLGDRERSGP